MATSIVAGDNLISMSTDAEQLQVKDETRELYFTINDLEIDL